MRRVIVEQIEALAELNRIVARHGRGIDTVEPGRRGMEAMDTRRAMDGMEARRAMEPVEPVRRNLREEPMVAGAGARAEAPYAAPRMEPARMEPTRMDAGRMDNGRMDTARMDARMEALVAPRAVPDRPLPPERPLPQERPLQQERPLPERPLPQERPVAQSPADRRAGWLTDVLTRASREEAPPRADDRPVRQGIESLDSLSVDIARMIDHDAAAELWDRYKQGERNVFTKRLYTLQGQKTFDEIRKRYRSDREFRQTVDRYIAEFERLLDEVSRDDRGSVMTRSYLTSETGKVYTMLAHAAGRFD
jgi:hypothetical protein